MNKIILIILLQNLLFANEFMHVIDTKIINIDKKRVGVSSKILRKIKNPFFIPIVVQENNQTKKQLNKSTLNKTNKSEKTKKAILNLQVILNKSVLINHKWYKNFQEVEGYKIIAIKPDYVLLDQYGEHIILRVNEQSQNIHFKKIEKKRVSNND